MMWAVLGFTATIITFLVVVVGDPELNKLIASTLMWICGAVVLGYLGIATVDDLNVMKHLGREAFEARPPGWPKDIAPPRQEARD